MDISTAGTNQLDPHEIAELQSARSKATASLVLGIIGIVLFGLCALVALPLGHIARGTFNKYPLHAHAFGKGRATAGVVLGWIVIGFWGLILILVIAAAAAVAA